MIINLKNKKIINPIILLFITFLSRWAVLGNPFIYADEEFYLFTGGRILQGDLPYIDIWDRKPIGIFLIYAFFHLFGNWRFIAYQTGAALSVWITAYFIQNIIILINSSKKSGIIGGTFYILNMTAFMGSGGQSPIFYNIFVAWAASIIVKYLIKNQNNNKNLIISGNKAMFLLGLAMQIKYTVIFEGCFMGLFLLYQGWKNKLKKINLVKNSCIWIIIAITPTLIIFLIYLMKGYGQEWWFANITSIFLKRNDFEITSLKKFFIFLFILFSTLILFYKSKIYKQINSRINSFLINWNLVALFSILFLKTFSNHYFLPFFVPFSIIISFLWKIKTGIILLSSFFIYSIIASYKAEKHILNKGNTQTFIEATNILSSKKECFFSYNGENILLDIANYCPLTKFPFSGHLSEKREAQTLRINTEKELKRILIHKPHYIFISEREFLTHEDNPKTDLIILQELTKNYKEIYRHKVNNKYSNIVIYEKLQ